MPSARSTLAALGSRLAAVALAMRRAFVQRGGSRSGGNSLFRVLLISALALFGALGWAMRYDYLSSPSEGQALNLSDLSRLSDNSQVLNATFLTEDARIVGQLCTNPVHANRR